MIQEEFYTEISIPVSRTTYDFSMFDEPDKERAERTKAAAATIKKAGRHRIFETIIATGLIISIGLFFMLLIMPTVELSELAKDNSDLKDDIIALKREILDSEEDTYGITDMDAIRAQALALGMQDPNENQVVTIPMPDADKLETVTLTDGSVVSQEAYNRACEMLESYYLENQSG